MPENRHAVEPEEMMAYLDGELPATRAAEAMNHLERCPDCQKLAADLRRVSQEMAAWQIEPPRVMAPPQPAVERPQWTFPSLFREPRYAIALAVSCIGLGLIVLRTTRPTHQAMGIARLASENSAIAVSQEPLRPPLPQASPIAAPPVENAAPAAPMIERTASLTVTTRDFDQLRARIDAILAHSHGYLADLTLGAPQGSGRSLNATLRVPAAILDATLAELRQLGRVESESQKGEDITRHFADLVARLTNARNTEQRLTQILAQRTGRLSDVLEVEREIDRVRGEIEQMEAERRTAADHVAFAIIDLTASEAYHAEIRLSPVSTGTRLRNAAVEGYRNMVEGLIAVATALMAYGPAVFLWALLAFLIGGWLLRRKKARN